MIHQLGSAIDLFLHPGEHAFADEHFCIRTTLGSCIAIVLWHPERKLGGMCHFMLPSRGRSPEVALDGKYGDEALELLRAEIHKVGTGLHQYRVKIFGGGNMFGGHFDVSDRDRAFGHANAGGNVRGHFSVAIRNVAAARDLVARHGLRVEAESVGGTGYRNVIFDIARGDVWVRHHGGGEPRALLG